MSVYISVSSINFNLYIRIFEKVKDIILDIFMTFSPSVNYLFQARKFYKTKSSKGFSNFLCLTLLISHTLKVYFWFGKKFKYTLLIQSILVVLIQLYIIYLCIKFKEDKDKNTIKNSINSNDTKAKIKKCINSTFLDWSKTFNIKFIWRWNNIIEYYKFYFLVVLLLVIFSFIFGIKNEYYINIIGIISILLETLCCVPQIIEIYKTKNQKNISKLMVFLWLSGNIIKIYYNIMNKSPMQLIIGSYIQAILNFILMNQIFYYYFKNKKESVNIREINLDEEKGEKKTVNIELTDRSKESNNNLSNIKFFDK